MASIFSCRLRAMAVAQPTGALTATIGRVLLTATAPSATTWASTLTKLTWATPLAAETVSIYGSSLCFPRMKRNTFEYIYMVNLDEVKILTLPKFLDVRGNLSVIEELKDIPFQIKREYWIYDVPGGEKRGGHAYKENREFIVALSGSFDVIIDNGSERKTYTLNRSYYGLYVPQGLWREMENFSTNSLALVLASTGYDPADYIYDYQEFKR